LSIPIVDFVVCTWNNRAIISSALEGVARQAVRDFTCTVVDDRSTDGTPELIRERFPWVNVVVKEKQTGPSPSRNIGLAKGSAEFIVFVDSDVTLDPRWAEIQIEFMRSDPRIGVACGRLLYAPMPDILHAAYGAMNRYGVAWDGGQGQPADHFRERFRCLWANTSAMIVRRDVIDQIGDFDGAMFTFHEDCDFGWRANLFGYQVVFNPSAVAVHLVHGTLDPQKMRRRLIYLVRRNRLRSSLVNYELGSLLRYTSVYLALAVTEGLVQEPRKEKLSALLWNLTQIVETLRRRRWVQSRRTVRDKELWTLFQKGIRGPGYGSFPRDQRTGLGPLNALGTATSDQTHSNETSG
jgi:GT2 family glycosyltransferase